MSTLIEYINPFHRRGWYIGPHAILAILILAVLALAGAFTVKYTASYFQHRYRAPLRAPGVGAPVHASVGALPRAASIHFAYFMTATNQQDGLGSCQSWSFSKQLSYAANWNRQANGSHLHHFFSPRFGYDLVSSGQDAGSYLEQYPPLARTVGVDRWIAFPYGDAARYVGFNPYAVDYPVPTVAFTAAHAVNVTEHQLFPDQGAGMAGVDLIRQALSSHHMVNIDTIVPPQFDNANQTQGNVAYYPNQPSRGGHAVVAVAYDDSHVDPYSGQVGAVLISNQWTDNYGIAVPSVTGSSVGGFAWLSYAFVAHDVWDAAVLHVSTAPITARPSLQAGKPLSADGGSTTLSKPPYHFQHGPTIPPPPHASLVAPGAITSPQAAAAAGYAWHVKNVELTDATDASALVNQWGDYFHIWPLGIAATIGTESGYNPRAYRWQAGLDKSCGLMQLIVTNVEPVIHSYDPFAACQWEYSAANSIWLGARYYRDAFAYQRGCVQFPQAYGLYNAGYAWPCGFYYNLTGTAYTNYEFNFLPNFTWALQHFQDFGPGPKPKPTPKPKPHFHFPRQRWCRADRRLHRHCPSSYAGVDRLSTIAFQWSHWHHAFHRRGTIDHACGGVIAAEHWNPKARVIHQRFSKCIVYEWPHFSGVPTRWHRAPRWRREMTT